MGQTRFDAATPADRRALFEDAIAAHDGRGSAFLTIEADAASVADASDGPDPALGPPWVQLGGRTVSFDCTPAELERAKALCGDEPTATVEELVRPDDAEGVHVRASVLADDGRVAAFLDEVFRTVYRLEETYRAWVVEV
ncbi:hypothetical protein [Natronobiforma cellulositropha]|uniref:hypothetical protein n=1 Tax=Natronobiforma cellulositropha TaxID=1679076 RepID=UPI0021D5B00B|nr:hypothetical protein [Natronobiforma cellulositropha]